jgi:hypothetical protein
VEQAPAINDFACRFKDGQWHPVGRDPYSACTRFLPELEYHFVDPASTLQFCGFLDKPFSFPTGDTMVAVRLRDVAGNVSPVAQLVILIAPPTVPATRTATRTGTPTVTPTKTAGPPIAASRTNFADSDGCAIAPGGHGSWSAALLALLPLALVCWRRGRRERKRLLS